MKVELVAAFLLAILVVLPSTIQFVQATDEVSSDAVAADVKKSSGTEKVNTKEKPSNVSAQAVDAKSSQVKSESETTGGKEKTDTVPEVSSTDSKKAVKFDKKSSKTDDASEVENSETGTSKTTNNKAAVDVSESKKRVPSSKKESKQEKSAKKIAKDLVEQNSEEDEEDEDEDIFKPLTRDEVEMFRGLVEKMEQGAYGEHVMRNWQMRVDGVNTTTVGVESEGGSENATTTEMMMGTETTAAAGTSVRKSTPLIATSLGAVSLAIMIFLQGSPA